MKPPESQSANRKIRPLRPVSAPAFASHKHMALRVIRELYVEGDDDGGIPWVRPEALERGWKLNREPQVYLCILGIAVLGLLMRYLTDPEKGLFRLGPAATRVLQQTHLATILQMVAFMAVGNFYYTNREFKEDCDDAIEVEKAANGLCTWSPWDALYFQMVTMSTVGYGDMSPSSDESRLFTQLYVIIGRPP